MVKVWINHDQVTEFKTANKWSVVEPRDILNIYCNDELIGTIRQWQYVSKVEITEVPQ